MKIRRFARLAQLALAMLVCLGSVAQAAENTQNPSKTETKPAEAKPAEKAAAPATSQNEVVARVNGRPIYATELTRIKKALQAGQQIPADKQKEFDKQALNQLVSAELLYQAGQKHPPADLDKQVEERYTQGKKRFPTEQDFQKATKELGMTENDLRDYTRRDIVISNFVQQSFASKITVSEEESKKFYDQNVDKFKQTESVRARHILIGVDSKATDADKKKAREKIESIRRSLAGGADFATLAKDHSTCPSSQQGGDLGFFGKGQMVPAFETAAFALKPGEISDVVETQFGYHIIKLVDRKDASTVPFKDVKARIDEYLKNQKVTAAVQAYLAETRKSAKIELL